MSTENPILDALQVSVIVNRKDQTDQTTWTEWRANIASGCPAAPGSIVMTNSSGTIDPCLLPSTTGLVIQVNGTPVADQNVLNFIPGSGIAIVSGAGGALTISATGTPGECGSAAYLCTDTSTPVEVDLSAPTHPGMLLISQPGNDTAIWADPLVQGLYPAGSSISSPPAYSPPTTIQPVLVGGEGTSPSGKDGLLHPLPLTEVGESVYVLQNPQEAINQGYTDPYQRGRISYPVTLFEESYQFFPVGPVTTNPPLATQFTSLTVGSGAFNRPANFANITATVGTDSGARAVWQTKSYFISQLGKGFGIFTTGNLGVNITNVITRIGAYDDDHGGFFEQNGQLGVLRVVFRANGLDTQAFPQSVWNIDKLDGTGASGQTLNMANGQSFVIDVGAGRVRYGFILGGVLYYCHAITVSNLVPAIVNSQSVVPVRFEILNAAASAGGSMWQSNLAVISESGYEDDPTAFAFSANTGASLIPITQATPILSIRPALLLNGHSNRAFITLRDFGVFSLGQIIQYQLVWNGTLTGASFNQVDPASGVEFDTSATAITDGRVVDSGYVSAFSKETAYSEDKFPFRLPFTLDITGTVQDVYTIVLTPMSANAQVGGSFKWQEEH